MSWAAGYVGIPFKRGGRTKEGADCWGLVYIVMREVFKKEVPSFSGTYEFPREDLAPGLKSIIMSHWEEVGVERIQAPEEGALVFMMYQGFPSHIGIVTDEGLMLHLAMGKDAVVERLGSPLIKPRIEGFYRVL